MTKKQKRVKMVIKSLKNYINSYDQQPHYTNYTDKTIIDDILYGLGKSLSIDFKWADGYEEFKDKLREHLG